MAPGDGPPLMTPTLARWLPAKIWPARSAWCDHLVLAAPLTPATRGLVDAAVLGAMKPDAHLVNVGRGALVDESALVSALIEGRIGGATLDVFDIEPLPIDHPLWEAPNVTITAHMSGDVVGWRDTLAAQYTENVRRWLVGEPLRNVVDKKLGYIPGAGSMIRQAVDLIDAFRRRALSPVEATHEAAWKRSTASTTR